MSMNVSLGSLEDFVLEKVQQGEYESTSEVLREGVRLLKRREELWRARVEAKIEEGMASLRAGRSISAQEAWSQLKARRDEAMIQP